MSRFQSPSPRLERIGNGSGSTTAEDEIINSILKKRQSRNLPGQTSRDAATINSSVASASSESGKDRHLEDVFVATGMPRQSEGEDALHAKTPYALLKRLANAAPNNGGLAPDSSNVAVSDANYAESYVSHTSRSIQEASALLERVDNQNSETSRLSFLAISQTMAKERAQDVDPQMSESDKFSPAEARDHSATRPNRTLFTPLATQERPRSREVAEGYISPPQSRQTSPELLSNGDTRSITHPDDHARSELELRRESHSNDSPSPGSFRKLSPSFRHKMTIPDRSVQDIAPTASVVGNSPRSRLTRTLLEIQSELAESREGIESIESRLEILEQHASVDRDMLQRHVEDCMKSMSDELDECSGIMEDAVKELEPDVQTGTGELDLGVAQSEEAVQSQQTFKDLQTPQPQRGTVFQLPISVRTIFYGMMTALATEWVVMAVLNELGRRKVLAMS